MSTEQKENEKTKEIFVNKKQIRVVEDSLTGRQILERAGFDVNQYDLFLIHGQNSQKIEPDQSIEIKNGQHYNAILKSVPYG